MTTVVAGMLPGLVERSRADPERHRPPHLCIEGEPVGNAIEVDGIVTVYVGTRSYVYSADELVELRSAGPRPSPSPGWSWWTMSGSTIWWQPPSNGSDAASG